MSRMLKKHDLTQDAEQVYANYPLLDGYMHDVGSELRLVQLCRTDRGRIMVIVTTERGGPVRFVTAYDADASQAALSYREESTQLDTEDEDSNIQ